MQHFQLLQGDVELPQTRTASLQVLLVLRWDLGRLRPFSLTRPQNGGCGLACGACGAAPEPWLSSAPLLIAALLLLFTAAVFDCFMDDYS